MPALTTFGAVSARGFGLCAVGKYGGRVLTYSLGVGGASVSGIASGLAGTATTVTFQGTTLTANGGAGGSFNTTTTAAGGTATGGDTNSTGGTGPGAAGDTGGGSGGAIGGVAGTWGGSSTGYTGAQSADVSGLQAAITALGYSWTAPGAGGDSSSSSPGRDGKPATGFGCGGGSSGYFGGPSGYGLWGGGGGGCGGYITASSGKGGDGIVIISINNGQSYYARTSGTSFTIPAGANTVKVWAIGGGGSGAGGTTNDTTSGGGAGAGGVAVKTWS